MERREIATHAYQDLPPQTVHGLEQANHRPARCRTRVSPYKVPARSFGQMSAVQQPELPPPAPRDEQSSRRVMPPANYFQLDAAAPDFQPQQGGTSQNEQFSRAPSRASTPIDNVNSDRRQPPADQQDERQQMSPPPYSYHQGVGYHQISAESRPAAAGPADYQQSTETKRRDASQHRPAREDSHTAEPFHHFHSEKQAREDVGHGAEHRPEYHASGQHELQHDRREHRSESCCSHHSSAPPPVGPQSTAEWQALFTASTAAAYQAAAQSLPKQRTITVKLPDKYDGSPLTYHSFIAAFERIVHKDTDDESERLDHLVNYTKGEARKVVEPYAAAVPNYIGAREALKQRFGRPTMVAQAFTSSLRQGSKLNANDGPQLRNLYHDMEAAAQALSSLGLRDRIDNEHIIDAVHDRLPLFLQREWAKKAARVDDSGEAVTFNMMTAFIKEQAHVANSRYTTRITTKPVAAPRQSKAAASTAYATDTAPSVQVNAATKPAWKKDSRPRRGRGKGGAAGDSGTKQQQTSSRCCSVCAGQCKSLADCTKFAGLKNDEKRNATYEAEVCFNCLWRGHQVRDCQKPLQCKVVNCEHSKYKHHTVLHGVKMVLPKREDRNRAAVNTLIAVPREISTAAADAEVTAPETVPLDGSTTPATEALVFSLQDGGASGKICLRVRPVTVAIGAVSVDTYALIDNGAACTLIDRQLATKLQALVEPYCYDVETISGSKAVRGHLTDLTVISEDGSYTLDLQDVHVQPKLALPSNTMATTKDLKPWSHLSTIELPDCAKSDIHLLIGMDNPSSHWSLEEIRGAADEPFASRGVFGWTVLGPVAGTRRRRPRRTVRLHHTLVAESPELQAVEANLARLWNTDFPDEADSAAAAMSLDDCRAWKMMIDSTHFVNGHYSMCLPWRDRATTKLPPSRYQAETRLQHLSRKLLKDPVYFARYKEQIEANIKSGFAREVTADELQNPREPALVWYLPHHGVQNPNKPGKVRVVFDCAATSRGVSLNSQLMQGPDLINPLIAVLMRFRQHRYAITADIEGMFNQVRVNEPDTDALRFLWYKNSDPTSTEFVTYKMLIQLFGGTHSPCACATAVRRTVDDHGKDFSPETVEAVLKDFYVDDLLKSAPTKAAATKLTAEITALLARGGFRLTKWLSNDPTVLASVPPSERSKTALRLGEDDLTDRALGLSWLVSNDRFVFDVKLRDVPATRRGVLSMVASLFDPLGLVAPVTLGPKLLLQELAREKLTWDQIISTDQLARWTAWFKQLPALASLTIPRCYSTPSLQAVRRELHMFADASTVGYGACVYLRQTDARGRTELSLVLGKSRLAPIKEQTVPRLELAAAVVATSLACVARRELNFDLQAVHYWTDSTVVLAYLANTSARYKTFVANRVSLIRERSTLDQWHHVPTAVNPADLASRGVEATDATALKFWLDGPQFLRQPEPTWPRLPPPPAPSDVLESEVRQVHAAVVQPSPLDTLLDHYSSWFRIRRAVAWLTRAQQHLAKRVSLRPGLDRFLADAWDPPRGLMSLVELDAAAELLLRRVQSLHYGEEIALLAKDKPVHCDSDLACLTPRLEDGVLVLHGRLKLEREKKLPILPRRSPLTTMVIRDVHHLNGHVGAAACLTLIRRKYWIVNGLAACKAALHGCLPCRRRHARPLTQVMADLPPERVLPDKPPFSFVGIDYFGPFITKEYRRQTTNKRWGVVFSCLSTRAVHLELAHSMDTDSFLAAMTRFIARRGQPLKCYSDNGSNLVAGAKALATMLQVWNQQAIHRYCQQREIAWHFNPPMASHMGGVFERMIRSVRTVLGTVVHSQRLHDESLRTLFCDAERIINSRPLTPPSTDCDDPEPLTPNHLLLLRPSPSLPLDTFHREDLSSIRWWRQAQALANMFWGRWLREYLPTLTTRSKWQRPTSDLRVGDIVLMVEEDAPRGRWPLAVVEETFPSADGHVRQALVRASNTKAGKPSPRYKRPIAKLCLLERAE